MKQNFLNNKIIFPLIMLMYFTGCTTKVAMRTWVPPQNTGQNIAAKADYLIIVNSHKGELLTILWRMHCVSVLPNCRS